MTARKKTPQKPEPVAVTTICSVCGLSWHDHGKDPTTEDCIRLLKAALASKPISVPQPYAVPVRPYPWYWEEWYARPRYPTKPGEITWSCSSQNEKSYENVQSFKEHTPRMITSTCNAVNGLSL